MKTCLCLLGLVDLLVFCQSDQRRTAIEKPRPTLTGQAPVVLVDSVEDVARMSHSHPTYAEAMKEACLAATENRAIHM